MYIMYMHVNKYKTIFLNIFVLIIIYHASRNNTYIRGVTFHILLMKRILILGGGFGGLAAAKELKDALGNEAEVVVVDKRDRTDFRPSYLYVMIGYREPNQVSAPLNLLERRGVEFVKAEVTAIDPANRVVKTTAGNMNYDYLIISLGAETHPELVRGGPAPHPWELEDALRLRDAIKGFKKGRIVVAVHSTPYRCPPAPWETALLLDYHFSGRGIRGDITITMAHPFKRPFENFGPLAAKLMEGMMQERKIEWIGLGKNPAVDYIDQDKKELVLTDGERVKYDLLILIPPHKPPKAVAESDIADPQTGWARATPPTFRTKYDDVYAIGDVAAPPLRLGMAGVILHSYLKYVVNSIVSDIKGTYIGSDFRIFASCALDVGGFGMAAACDFTKIPTGQAPYPDCMFLPPSSTVRIFKEFFEKEYFAWLLKYVPG